MLLGGRWSLTPTGIKRFLSFSSFSQDIPFAGPTPTPITQPQCLSVEETGNFSDCSLLVSVLMDHLVRLTWCCLHDSVNTQEERITCATPNSQVRYGVFGKQEAQVTFTWLVGRYKMPLIITPSFPTLFSHQGEVISNYRGVGPLGSLKPRHPSLSTFQRSPFSCLSLVPCLQLNLAGRSREK